jgi:hypothetical protein
LLIIGYSKNATKSLRRYRRTNIPFSGIRTPQQLRSFLKFINLISGLQEEQKKNVLVLPFSVFRQAYPLDVADARPDFV